MVDQFLSDNSTDILYQHASEVKWEPYNKLHVANYKRVHYDTKSDVVVLQIMSKKELQLKALLEGKRRRRRHRLATSSGGEEENSGDGERDGWRGENGGGAES